MNNLFDQIERALKNAETCSPDIGKHRYREALTALQEFRKRMPDCVVVPREPTEAMTFAGDQVAHDTVEPDGDFDGDMADNIYRAMLSAAPPITKDNNND